jgi:hypothetical protein
MRSIVLGTLLVGGALTLLPAEARAFCGFYVAGADAKLFNNATLVVMMRDGTRTVLSMQNNYQGPPANFAMVVPVPIVLQKENVKTLPREVFDRVDQMAAPRLVEYWEQDPCAEPSHREKSARRTASAPAPGAAAEASDGAFGVKIEAQFTVGEYEIVILSANDALGLDAWLRKENYRIPEGAAPLLRPYIEGGMKFFVAKVDVTKVKFEGGMAMLSPLRFHYDTDTFNLPVRLGLVNSAGMQDLIVHILAKNQRYEVANYGNVTIPTNLDVAETARDQFGAFYAALFDQTLEKNPKSVVTEYAWSAQNCDPCPSPTLTPSELITLGADVLPSTIDAPPLPSLSVSVPRDPVGPLFYQLQSDIYRGFSQCYGEALKKDRNLKGKVNVFVSSRPAEIQGADGFPPEELGECLKRHMATVQYPPVPRAGRPPPPDSNPSKPGPVTVPVEFKSTPNWNTTAGFVLTRLHARYGKESLGEDLVFRQAPPISGGREVRDQGGTLEHGSQSGATINNFQARYAIRHPWTGPIACAAPRRGVWGGPPSAKERETRPKPATNLAFAPREGVKLASFLQQEVPELGITAPSAAASKGCGACRVGDGEGGDHGSAAGLFAAGLAALGAMARRLRRP